MNINYKFHKNWTRVNLNKPNLGLKSPTKSCWNHEPVRAPVVPQLEPEQPQSITIQYVTVGRALHSAYVPPDMSPILGNKYTLLMVYE